MAEEKNQQENSEIENNDSKVEDSANGEQVQPEHKELTPEEKYLELNDRFLRLFAEFDNFRKRSNKEKIDIISNANAGVLKDLLPVLDDFERAINNNANSQDIEMVKEGFHLIFNKLKSILEAKGLKQMDAKGQPFDSEMHEAIANTPVEKDADKGLVVDDVEKGYYLNDKVIRYAKVVVGQ
jgi:molecular chaperone GrpE